MTYILLTAFVWGISKVIDGVAEFFDFDIDYFYHWRTDRSHPAEYSERPLWQKFILKPTIYCNICMSSFWGSVAYWGLLNGRDWGEWILHCVICAGAIFFMNLIVDKLEIN